ncbi:UNVERIFIED_CONTAM: hypothetical protein Sradi_0725200 [Sesamum radiatum]|uniref:Uncharacterized protein n=1 Tax=Sesamum radiatum TaxID=300843 RepID=A0AAW2VND1_SESRA
MEYFRSLVPMLPPQDMMIRNPWTSIGLPTGKAQGVVIGCEVYLQFDDFKVAILKAHAFQVAVEIKAAEFGNDGFERCRYQVNKLGGLQKDSIRATSTPH